MMHTSGSMITTAPLPNEWRCQSQSAPTENLNDELWHVEWGDRTVSALREERAWAATASASHGWDKSNCWQGQQQQQQQPQTMECQPVYCIDGVYCVAVPMEMAQAQEMQACVVAQFPAEAGCTPGPTLPARGEAEKDTPITPPGTFTSQSQTDTSAVSQEDSQYDGELPSVGSVGHDDGSCKRCAFFPKGRCQNGKDCTHCHFAHLPRSRLRKRCVSRRDTEAGSADAESEAGNDKLQDIDCADSIQTPSDVQSARSSFTQESLGMIETAKAILDDKIEVETTTSASCPSDNEDRASFGFDSEKLSMVDSSSATSDSEIMTPTGTESPTTTLPGRKSQGFGSSPASWAAQQRIRRKSSPDTSAAEVGRMARSILNKLTEERFESLAGQLLALPLSTPEQLAVVTAELFEKATTEPGFLSLYTELCIRLDTHLAEQNSAMDGKAFRKALTNEVQATFEHNLQPADATLFKDLQGDERFEAEMKLKNRRLGNMRFIGELLVRRLLAPKLICPIIFKLLSDDEAALEDLIALLMVVAPFFEKHASLFQAPLKDAFVTLQQKKASKVFSTRLDCQISDLLDARSRAWAPRAVLAA